VLEAKPGSVWLPVAQDRGGVATGYSLITPVLAPPRYRNTRRLLLITQGVGGKARNTLRGPVINRLQKSRHGSTADLALS